MSERSPPLTATLESCKSLSVVCALLCFSYCQAFETSNDIPYFSRTLPQLLIHLPLMCMSTAYPQIGKSETIHHAELYQENVGSKARMGSSSYRDQKWEERKHVDDAGEKGIYQPDNRVKFHAVSFRPKTIRSDKLPANEMISTDY